MKVEIFYTSEQEEIERAIRRLLASRISPILAPRSYLIHGLGDQIEAVQMRHEFAARYLKLLQASVLPLKQLNVFLTGPISYGFYAVSYYHGRVISFQSGFRSLLPAVAIQDRMVLVPHDLGKSLTGTEELLSLFRPLEMEGVIEVNFEDPSALEGAVTKVAQKVRSDMIEELRAYASYRPREEINFAKLAQDLGIDWRFIKDTLQARVRESTFYNQLSCRIDRQELPLGRWTKVTLTIENTSELGLSGLTVEISGPVQILPRRLQTDIVPQSTQELTISIRPEDLGDFPLEVVFFLPEDQVFLEWMPVHHVWLQVTDSKAAAQA